MFLGYNVILDNFIDTDQSNCVETLLSYLKDRYNYDCYNVEEIDIKDKFFDYESVIKYPHIKAFIFYNDNNTLYVSSNFDALQKVENIIVSKKEISNDLVDVYTGRKNRVVIVYGHTLVRLENKSGIKVLSLEGVQ